jgi:hypothetical protein
VYNVTIKHEQFEGGEQHWTVPGRPYYDTIRDEDALAVMFFDKNPHENEDAKMTDWVVLPKRGFGFIRATLLTE